MWLLQVLTSTLSYLTIDTVKSGTSTAVAHVSGVAALAFSIANDVNDDGLINDEVRQAIEDGCSPINAKGTGKGRINAQEALTLLGFFFSR